MTALTVPLCEEEVDVLVYSAVRAFQDLRSKHQIVEEVMAATKLGREEVAASLLRIYNRMSC